MDEKRRARARAAAGPRLHSWILRCAVRMARKKKGAGAAGEARGRGAVGGGRGQLTRRRRNLGEVPAPPHQPR